MSKNESSKLPVLMVAFISREDVSPVGLPVLKIYVNEDEYLLWEGDELIKTALVETIKWRKEASIVSLRFAVEVLPMSQRPRRRRRKQGDAE